jgi:hypothetical protein
MHAQITQLLTSLENASQTPEIKAAIAKLIPLSISYQMTEISADDAISNFEDANSRMASESEKTAIKFGFMCGIDCE